MNDVIAMPFIHWAGGKRQLIGEIEKRYPPKTTTYIEPFLGGGAVLFNLLSKYTFDKVVINDINAELINTYIQVRDNVKLLIKGLTKIQEEYLNFDEEERKEIYYFNRERFNHLVLHRSKLNNLEKAILFIFLNKTCFNGLYRVNKKGIFNVPIGTYKKRNIFNKSNLINVSLALQDVVILCGNYSECLQYANKDAFIYIDPPYRPLPDAKSFVAYDKSGFNDQGQVKLKGFVDKLRNIGATVLVSNSDTKDNFFDDLYETYTISRVLARRSINSDGKNRGKINELLITN